MGETRYEVYPLSNTQTVYQTIHPDGRVEGEVKSTHKWRWGRAECFYYGQIICPLCQKKGYLEVIEYENSEPLVLVRHVKSFFDKKKYLEEKQKGIPPILAADLAKGSRSFYCTIGRTPLSIVYSLIFSTNLWREGKV